MKQLVLQSMTQLSAHPANHTQWYQDGPFVQKSKGLCQITLPLPTTYNTTHIRTPKWIPNSITVEGHTVWVIMTNEMCGSQVTVMAISGHSDLSVDDQPHSKRNYLQSVDPVSIWVSTGYFPPIGLHATNDHPTHTFHPSPGHAFALPCQEGQVPDLYCSC